MKPILPELERQLRAAASPRAAATRRRMRRGLLAVAVVPFLGGVAFAAGALWDEGSPVPLPRHYTPKPTEGLGIPVEGTVRLSDLRVPDPAGGPPWGLRVLQTTRGSGCVQIGRIVDGKLGVLGVDGAFNNDGKFHELRPDDLEIGFCGLLDANKRAFVGVSFNGLIASAAVMVGDRPGCVVSRPTGALARRLERARAKMMSPERLRKEKATQDAIPVCKRADLRTVRFGLLGPQARSYSYKADDGKIVTVPVADPDGAYLVVSRHRKSRGMSDGSFAYGAGPGIGLVAVHYADGTVCKQRRPDSLGGAKRCPLKGRVAPKVEPVTSAQVRSPLKLTASRARFDGPPSVAVRVAFTARVASTGNGGVYAYWAASPRTKGCGGGVMMSGAIQKDIRAGDRVSTVFYVPRACHGVWRGGVYFDATRDSGDPLLGVGPPPLSGFRGAESTPVVGRFTYRR